MHPPGFTPPSECLRHCLTAQASGSSSRKTPAAPISRDRVYELTTGKALKTVPGRLDASPSCSSQILMTDLLALRGGLQHLSITVTQLNGMGLLGQTRLSRWQCVLFLSHIISLIRREIMCISGSETLSSLLSKSCKQ